MRIANLLFVVALFWSVQGFSQNVEHLGSSHVHEAFMNSEAPITLLTAIPQQPPQFLKETIPQQPDSQSVWVQGYWEWSFERNEFVWCSGCWRRPPPAHQWVPGYWKKLDEGWVRLKGFWSATDPSSLSYISKSPPDAYDENPTNRPGNDYFWMSGYWKSEKNKYTWYSGKWEQLDQNWIYVPPKYVWRPEGYIFVPAFWDFPLDQRGIAYVCVAVPQDQTQITYDPDMIIELMSLIEGCILYYPDYYYFYFYYCHFHVDWWWGCAWCPPWWGWVDWWWMPWGDQWGLWWWWCHPGFPAPFWLDAWLMDMIFGPPMPLINAMKDIHSPLIIGPNGLIPPANLIDAAGDDKPVFPEDSKDIQEEAGKDVDQGSTDRPQGPKVPRDELDEKAPPAPQTTPRPPANAAPGKQPETPPSSVVPTPPKPKTPPKLPEQPPRQPSRPSYQPPVQRPPEKQTIPPSYYPPQDRRPSRPPSYQPQQPQRPSRPSRPAKPRPSRPEAQPPSQTQPSYPQNVPSYRPQYNPQSPSIQPQYRPQSPSIQPQYRPQSPSIQPQQQQQYHPKPPSNRGQTPS